MTRSTRTADSTRPSTPTLWTVFDQRAAADPHALAVVDDVVDGVAGGVVDGVAGERTHTRGQLHTDALAFGTRLRDEGLNPGDVISVQLPNRYETVVVALAALRMGLVLNLLLPNYRARELDHIFRAARPRAVVSPDAHRGHDHVAMLDELTERGALAADATRITVDSHDDSHDDGHDGSEIGGFLRELRSLRPDAGPVHADVDQVSELIFSSGTEATPKGVMHTEQTTNAGVVALHRFLDLGDDDVVWMPSPVGHSTGFNFGLRFALYHGLPLVLQDRWSASAATRLVQRYRCTYTLAATTFLQDLVDEARRTGDRLDSLANFACGGAPVPPELVTAAGAVGIDVLRLYGSTEALVVTCNRPGDPLAQRLHTDGVALPGVEIRTRCDAGQLCGAGEPGEIEVRTWQGAVGYLDDPDRTAATFADDGWIRSGDLGVIGHDGALSIVGRKKEIIIRGGLNITPREIEEMVLAFAEVERCAVIGLPDQRLGEVVCACVCLQPGASLTLDQLVERLRAGGLATYKLPQRLHVVDELPATASGKVQKHVLRARLQRGGG